MAEAPKSTPLSWAEIEDDYTCIAVGGSPLSEFMKTHGPEDDAVYKDIVRITRKVLKRFQIEEEAITSQLVGGVLLAAIRSRYRFNDPVKNKKWIKSRAFREVVGYYKEQAIRNECARAFSNGAVS